MQEEIMTKQQKTFGVFLIKTPYLHLFTGEKVNMFPIGLATIAGVLRAAGFPITFLDPENQNMTTTDVVAKIEHEKPAVVGVSCVSANFSLATEYLNGAKRASALTILGGNHASAEDPKVLLEKYPYIDFVLFGEADYTVLELCRFLEAGRNDYENIPGLAYRKDGVSHVNQKRAFIEDIDTLPSPVWDLVDMNKYTVSNFIWRGKGAVPLMTSRGCPTFCIFCATSQVNGRRFRAQSAERIVRDVEHLVKTYNTKYIVFVDDIFTINKERIRKFCDLMIERQLNVQWFCLARVNTVDKDLLSIMKNAGCNWIEYGVETGDEQIMKTIRKGITIQQAREAFRMTKEVGIKVFGTFMFGHPGETKETIEKTINFSIELNPDLAQFSIVAPLPGTELWGKYRETVYIVKDAQTAATYGINTESNEQGYIHRDFTADELQAALTSAFRRFYLRPRYVFCQLLKIRSKNDVLYLLEGGVSVLKQAFSLKLMRDKKHAQDACKKEAASTFVQGS